ncbi:MotA/TolQ/ExbB proton channel family protein [Tichowtungia aerotolerans]|uniref:Biopolymer transporter ExbB n=1 Tax=Tichowtungia aerotolerans TaxID=2697043 RepID=A0A6P1MDP7_9BACT|nr:MotA/TolQ/ExbB proton channel family protein [Tichowtungia aerotolerans]QHI69225.1 biopolymer transporter ExbB [Tichowtungia aerotolerans]
MNGLLLPIFLGNVMEMFNQSALPGKLIILLLFVSSVGVWYVMFTKMFQLSRARLGSERFLSLFRQKSNPFEQGRRIPESPLNTIYEAGCAAISTQGNPPLSVYQVEAVRAVVDRTMADEALLLEDGMGLLATAVSACPFLGLLGTVWGVMDAFGGMAASGAATLSAVAPGIAGALLTTVVGLLVALPSAIGYNLLTTRIRRLSVQMDNFVQEFGTAVQQHFGTTEA